jgi:hypothetical protein
MIVGAGPQRGGVRTAACGEDKQSVQAPTVEGCWSGARRQAVGASTAAVGLQHGWLLGLPPASLEQEMGPKA